MHDTYDVAIVGDNRDTLYTYLSKYVSSHTETNIDRCNNTHLLCLTTSSDDDIYIRVHLITYIDIDDELLSRLSNMRVVISLYRISSLCPIMNAISIASNKDINAYIVGLVCVDGYVPSLNGLRIDNLYSNSCGEETFNLIVSDLLDVQSVSISSVSYVSPKVEKLRSLISQLEDTLNRAKLELDITLRGQIVEQYFSNDDKIHIEL